MSRLVYCFLGALLFASGAEASCPSTTTCLGAGTQNTATGYTYSIGFQNTFSSQVVCLYQCLTTGQGTHVSTISPPAIADDQYWPMVGVGERYAGFILNGNSLSTQVAFTNAGNEGYEVVCDGAPQTQAGADFVAVIPSSRRLRRLLGISRTINTSGK